MAKTYIQNMLGENERIILVTRQHGFVLFGAIVAEITITLILIAIVSLATIYYPIAALGFLLVLLPFISMLRDILIWNNHEYIVTNRRVIQISGIFNKNVVDSSLEKVNDVKMSQSFMGRLLDYGNIEILTASELGVNKFTYIGRPIQYKTAMINAKERLERAPMQPAAATAPAASPADLLTQLDTLRQHGVLSEAEFQAKKAELLKRM